MMNALTSQFAPRPHNGGIVPFIQHHQLFTEDHPVRGSYDDFMKALAQAYPL
jgi:hypothetical protein